MNGLANLYDNFGIFHSAARAAHADRDMTAAELLYQMAEHTQDQIEQVKASRKAGGKAESK